MGHRSVLADETPQRVFDIGNGFKALLAFKRMVSGYSSGDSAISQGPLLKAFFYLPLPSMYLVVSDNIEILFGILFRSLSFHAYMGLNRQK